MTSFDYQIVRRPRRKTVCVTVSPDGSVRILAPAFLAEQKIEELVRQKSGWIKSRISQFRALRESSQQKRAVSGECLAYLGRNFRLKLVSGDPARDGVRLADGRFHVPVPPGLGRPALDRLVAEQLADWYRPHAAVCLQEKTAQLAARLAVEPALVDVKDYRSRWGSCHADGRIYFNWRIIAAPHAVIDYVVAHELCHLIHMDHSKRFWSLLATVLPDYPQRREWLRINGHSLSAQPLPPAGLGPDFAG